MKRPDPELQQPQQPQHEQYFHQNALLPETSYYQEELKLNRVTMSQDTLKNRRRWIRRLFQNKPNVSNKAEERKLTTMLSSDDILHPALVSKSPTPSISTTMMTYSDSSCVPASPTSQTEDDSSDYKEFILAGEQCVNTMAKYEPKIHKSVKYNNDGEQRIQRLTSPDSPGEPKDEPKYIKHSEPKCTKKSNRSVASTTSTLCTQDSRDSDDEHMHIFMHPPPRNYSLPSVSSPLSSPRPPAGVGPHPRNGDYLVPPNHSPRYAARPPTPASAPSSADLRRLDSLRDSPATVVSKRSATKSSRSPIMWQQMKEKEEEMEPSTVLRPGEKSDTKHRDSILQNGSTTATTRRRGLASSTPRMIRNLSLTSISATRSFRVKGTSKFQQREAVEEDEESSPTTESSDRGATVKCTSKSQQRAFMEQNDAKGKTNAKQKKQRGGKSTSTKPKGQRRLSNEGVNKGRRPSDNYGAQGKAGKRRKSVATSRKKEDNRYSPGFDDWFAIDDDNDGASLFDYYYESPFDDGKVSSADDVDDDDDDYDYDSFTLDSLDSRRPADSFNYVVTTVSDYYEGLAHGSDDDDDDDDVITYDSFRDTTNCIPIFSKSLCEYERIFTCNNSNRKKNCSRNKQGDGSTKEKMQHQQKPRYLEDDDDEEEEEEEDGGTKEESETIDTNKEEQDDTEEESEEEPERKNKEEINANTTVEATTAETETDKKEIEPSRPSTSLLWGSSVPNFGKENKNNDDHDHDDDVLLSTKPVPQRPKASSSTAELPEIEFLSNFLVDVLVGLGVSSIEGGGRPK
ncbi:hypothetical protein ACA910_020491 [Epithemia clementina (nom. ined.)]